MLVTKSKLQETIQLKIEEIVSHMSGKTSFPDMTPVVFVYQESKRKYHVGWNFEKRGLNINDLVTYDDGTVNGQTAILKYIHND